MIEFAKDLISMENLEIFEEACKYFSHKISEFKEILSIKVRSLENKDWIYNKGF